MCSNALFRKKNNQDAVKIRLRCHRSRYGCKGTAHITEGFLTVMQKWGTTTKV